MSVRVPPLPALLFVVRLVEPVTVAAVAVEYVRSKPELFALVENGIVIVWPLTVTVPTVPLPTKTALTWPAPADVVGAVHPFGTTTVTADPEAKELPPLGPKK